MAGGVGGGADLVIIPEDPIAFDRVVRHVRERVAASKFSIIVVAEGGRVTGIDPAIAAGKVDQFGHAQLATRGIGTRLAEAIEERTGVESRVTVLGYVQRGGSPSMFDRVLATRMGAAAVDFLHEGRVGVIAAIRGTDIVPVPLAEIVGHNRTVDRRYFHLMRRFEVLPENPASARPQS
jgi:6-phosphofructokinase 1